MMSVRKMGMIMITTMGMKIVRVKMSFLTFPTQVWLALLPLPSPQINQNTGRSSGGVGDGGEEMFIVEEVVEGEVMEEEVMEGEMIMVTEVMMTVGEEMMCEENPILSQELPPTYFQD